MGGGVGIIRIRYDIPLGLAGLTGLVATPAYILATEDDGLRRKSPYEFLPGRIIIGLPSLALRMRPVEPHLMYRAILREQFEKLIEEIFVVIVYDKLKAGGIGKRPAGHLSGNRPLRILTQIAVKSIGILYLIKVGRREINAELQAILAARLGEFAQDIALPLLKPCRHDAMLRVAALPKHKTVVVLDGKQHHLHAGRLHSFAPLVGIEFAQSEDLGIFLTRSPLTTGKGIRAKMYESDEFILQRSHLVGGRNYMSRFVNYTLGGIVGSNLNGIGKRNTYFLRPGYSPRKNTYRKQQATLHYFFISIHCLLIIYKRHCRYKDTLFFGYFLLVAE